MKLIERLILKEWDSAAIIILLFCFMEHYRNTSLKDIIEEIDGITYTEEWKPLKGFETHYLISSFGRIKKPSRKIHEHHKYTIERIKIGSITVKGYVRIIIRHKNKAYHFYAHRLVGLHYLPINRNKPCINHKKGIKTQNHYSQIEWCTIQENNNHAVKFGLAKRGKGSMGGTSHIYIKKGDNRKFKKIINTKTGEIINSEQLAKIWGTEKRYVRRILSEERKPNTTEYKYA